MTAFYIYSPDGGPQPPDALEYALNLEVPRRQLIERAQSGVGRAAYASEIPEGMTLAKAWRTINRHEEWAPATPDACLWVWWRYATDPHPDTDTEPADEVWRLTPDGGTVTRERTTDDVRHRKDEA